MPVQRSEPRYRPDCVSRDCGNCTIFLAYTSNMVSSGLRDVVRFLVQHNYVDVIVTTAGGIEEDFIKCLAPTYVGDFHRYRGAELRRRGVNRIGNLYVPNTNYCAFENWVTPIFDELLEEQRTKVSAVLLNKSCKRFRATFSLVTMQFFGCLL